MNPLNPNYSDSCGDLHVEVTCDRDRVGREWFAEVYTKHGDEKSVLFSNYHRSGRDARCTADIEFQRHLRWRYEMLERAVSERRWPGALPIGAGVSCADGDGAIVGYGYIVGVGTDEYQYYQHEVTPLGTGPEPSVGVQLIAEQRSTHAAKGWTAAHDDAEHSDGSLLVAAMILIAMRLKLGHGDGRSGKIGDVTLAVLRALDCPSWMWEMAQRYQFEPSRILIPIAGSLLAADTDRLERARI